jgi:type IV secretory pathway protease TraF
MGELVAVTPPPMLAGFLARRGYLPIGVPLLKHIAALTGRTVCRVRDTIAIDGTVVAHALNCDRRGRILPRWQGCRTLRIGEVFLLNAAVPDSVDGRYFGVLPATTITVRAHPLWTLTEN